MKKLSLRFFCLLLCLCMVCSCLCGCSILEKILNKVTANTLVLEETTEFYLDPQWDSFVLTTREAGYEVTIEETLESDGAVWALTEDGWFVLEGTRPAPQIVIRDSYYVSSCRAFPYDSLPIYKEPATFSQAIARVEPGQLLEISEIAETAEGTWGFAAVGWVNMQNVYVEGSLTGTHQGFGVVREENVAFSDLPDYQSTIVVFADPGFRFQIYEQIFINGTWWAYTPHGWVCMDFVYEEGTVGTRPCKAMVIDKTPLNVRLAPGTDNEILSTLRYGDYVQILERVERNGKDWGFTGKGWIYMDLTEIQ